MNGPLRYACNTNGFAHHRLGDALRVMADLGYEGSALAYLRAPEREAA